MKEILMEPCIGIQFVHSWRRHSKENLDEDVHKKIGFVTFSKAATKRDSKIAWIQRENWCTFEQFRHTGGATIQPWIMYEFRTIGQNLSSTELLRLFTIKCPSQSLDSQRRVRKEDKLVSSRLLIHSEVMHMNRKNQVKIIRYQEKSTITVIGEMTRMPCTG